MAERLLTERGLWLFAAWLLGSLSITTYFTARIAFADGLIIVGIIGTGGSLLAAWRPQLRVAVRSVTVIMVLWSVFRPFGFAVADRSNGSKMGIIVIWVAIPIMFAVWFAAVTALRDRDLRIRELEAHLRKLRAEGEPSWRPPSSLPQ